MFIYSFIILLIFLLISINIIFSNPNNMTKYNIKDIKTNKNLNNKNIKNKNNIGEHIGENIGENIGEYIDRVEIFNVDNIDKINNIYDEIIELKSLIKLSDKVYNFISVDNLKEIKQFSKKYNKLQSLTNIFYNNMNTMNRELHKVKKDCCKLNRNNNIILSFLEIIKFNLEKKKRLKEIFEVYYNEDYVKELLIKLYIKEIKLIESEIK